MVWCNSNAQTLEDSVNANNMLEKYGFKEPSKLKFKRQFPELSLEKKHIISIAKLILNHIYGKHQIRKQKPFHIYKIDDYWIIWGNSGYLKRRNRYGGVFEMIINGQNGCVEMLSHGK